MVHTVDAIREDGAYCKVLNTFSLNGLSLLCGARPTLTGIHMSVNFSVKGDLFGRAEREWWPTGSDDPHGGSPLTMLGRTRQRQAAAGLHHAESVMPILAARFWRLRDARQAQQGTKLFYASKMACACGRRIRKRAFSRPSFLLRSRSGRVELGLRPRLGSAVAAS